MTDERIREIGKCMKVAAKVVKAGVYTHHWAEKYIEHVTLLMSERDAAIEQACKDVCEWCAKGHGVKFYSADKEKPWLGWAHPSVPNESGPACKAAAIRTRVAAQGEK